MGTRPEPDTISTFHLRRRTPGSFVLVPCPRIGRTLRCQGQLEAAAAVVLGGCPLVKTVREQPMQVWYSWRDDPRHGVRIDVLDDAPPSNRRNAGGTQISYTVPDFEVEMQDGRRWIVEVKASKRLVRPIVRRKLAAASAFATRHGCSFHVVTEKHLLQGPLLRNLRLLARYRHLLADGGLASHIEQGVERQGTLLAEVLSAIKVHVDGGTLRSHIFHLLSVGRLSFDPRKESLGNDTVLFPRGVVTWDPFASVWEPSGFSTDAPIASSASSAMGTSLPPTPSSG